MDMCNAEMLLMVFILILHHWEERTNACDRMQEYNACAVDDKTQLKPTDLGLPWMRDC